MDQSAPDHLDHAPTRPNRFVNDWRTKAGGFGTIVSLLIAAVLNTSGAKSAAEKAKAAVADLVPRVVVVETRQQSARTVLDEQAARLRTLTVEVQALERRLAALDRDLYSVRVLVNEDTSRAKRRR